MHMLELIERERRAKWAWCAAFCAAAAALGVALVMAVELRVALAGASAAKDRTFTLRFESRPPALDAVDVCSNDPMTTLKQLQGEPHADE